MTRVPEERLADLLRDVPLPASMDAEARALAEALGPELVIRLEPGALAFWRIVDDPILFHRQLAAAWVCACELAVACRRRFRAGKDHGLTDDDRQLLAFFGFHLKSHLRSKPITRSN